MEDVVQLHLFLTHNCLVVKLLSLSLRFFNLGHPEVKRKYRFIWKIEEGVVSRSVSRISNVFNREICNREKFIEFKEEF